MQFFIDFIKNEEEKYKNLYSNLEKVVKIKNNILERIKDKKRDDREEKKANLNLKPKKNIIKKHLLHENKVRAII